MTSSMMASLTKELKHKAFILALFGLIICSGMMMVRVPVPAQYAPLSVLTTALFAAPTFWVSRRWLGWAGVISLWVLLAMYALSVETFALRSGFPYGSFTYTEQLWPKIAGTTPVIVAFAWTPIILGAYAVAAQFTRHSLLRSATAGLAAAAMDMVLDPGSVRLGFWTYGNGGSFYGVPWTNFAGWVLTGFVGALIIDVFARRSILPVPVKLASGAFCITLFWTAADFSSGLWLPGSIGVGVLIALAALWIKYSYEFDAMLVLGSDSGSPLATMPKALVHTGSTPLHLAFSVFVFDAAGKLLLQQRAWTKKTWPGVWSNSCCGHLMAYETPAAAVRRRLRYELGLRCSEVIEMVPDFRYHAEKHGIVENEICPVFVARCRQRPRPRPSEVSAVRWIDWEEFLREIRRPETSMSPWAIMEAELLENNPRFHEWRRPSRDRSGGTAPLPEPI